MTTFIVGGSPAAREPKGLQPGTHDRVIAADLGAHHARAWGWPVHLLVGDLDSLDPEEARALLGAGTSVVRMPAAKDETDLELALAHALTGTGEIVICAALGGRTDHLLANLLLLARADLAARDVRLVDGRETVRLLRAAPAAEARLSLHGRAGDLVSLLPAGGDAEGVRTSGLRYPLRDETLALGQARGVSNVMEDSRAAVSLRRGMLWVIHTAGESAEEGTTENA